MIITCRAAVLLQQSIFSAAHHSRRAADEERGVALATIMISQNSECDMMGLENRRRGKRDMSFVCGMLCSSVQKSGGVIDK